MFAGHSNTKIGPELVFNKSLTNTTKGAYKRLNNTGKVLKYANLKPGIRDFYLKTKTPPNNKPLPTPDDYLRGFCRRYFTKKINNTTYLEIDKQTYDIIKSKAPVYDFNLFEVGYIVWYLRGNVHQLNTVSLKLAERRFPSLITLFPILNEYVLDTKLKNLQEDLHTGGGELWYIDGTEYIGSYHIHPTKGPMEGAVHKEKSHARLYYTNQLPNYSSTSYQDLISHYGKIKCFSCKVINNTSRIIESKSNKISGCPSNTYETREEAFNNCSGKYSMKN